MYGQRRTAYQDSEVMSSSPERLIPLMYEKLLVSLKRGAVCMRSKDFEGKHESLGRALDIISELVGSLDFEHGGEIAQRLVSLYGFWSREVSQAGRGLQPDRIDRVAVMVAELHEAWAAAVRTVESGEAAVPAGREVG